MRVHIIVEGETEEAFVNEVLYPHFLACGVFLNAILAPSKRRATARVHRGGGHSFKPALFAIQQKLKEDPTASCTTLFDYYGLPPDFPGLGNPALPPPAQLAQRISFLEQELDTATGNTGRLVPYLQVHEFEAILFSDVSAIDSALDVLGGHWNGLSQLQTVLTQAGAPEAINDGPTTAPSKRLKAIYPGYDKVFFGPLIAGNIGLAQIRSACPRFHAWMCRLEGLAPNAVVRPAGTPDCD